MTTLARCLFALASALGLMLVTTPAQALTAASKLCNISFIDMDVQNNGNRMLIRCDSPATGAGGASIAYFAVNTTKLLERAKMVLSIATAAKIAGRQVTIHYFSDDTTTNNWDMACNPTDCRPIARIQLN